MYSGSELVLAESALLGLSGIEGECLRDSVGPRTVLTHCSTLMQFRVQAALHESTMASGDLCANIYLAQRHKENHGNAVALCAFASFRESSSPRERATSWGSIASNRRYPADCGQLPTLIHIAWQQL